MKNILKLLCKINIHLITDKYYYKGYNVIECLICEQCETKWQQPKQKKEKSSKETEVK